MKTFIKNIYKNPLVFFIALLTGVNGILYTDSTSRPNLALGKPTAQSSTHGLGDSALAVDGNTSSVYDHLSCSHTQTELNPWWRVDLQREYVIDTVKVTNRGDGLGFRLRDMSILVGNSEATAFKDNPVCVEGQSLFDGETRAFSCTGFPKGRYVYITLSRSKPNTEESTKAIKPRIEAEGTLTLCEVQVFARQNINYEVNVASGKVATQSSTDGSYKPLNALDSILTTCSKTEMESKPWWRVDLTLSFKVASVRIGVCEGGAELDALQVLAGNKGDIQNSINQVCEKKPEESASEFICAQYIASQFVFVRSKGQAVLSLSKVEVFVAERIMSDSVCEEKQIGGNGDVSDIDIPERLIYTSTTIDHWYDGDTTMYEAFGTQVYMSEIIQGLTQLKHQPNENDKETKAYRLRIRADTFYCSKKEQKDGEPYLLHGLEKMEIIARKIVGDGCEINFTQLDRKIVDEEIINENAGASGTDYGMPGGNGMDGKEGLPGRGITVIMSYLESVGKISMTANGGNGGNGLRGHDGGDGFKGSKGKDGSKEKCEHSKGGKGGNGGNGGKGGDGGIGGSGGHGGHWLFLTPGNSEDDVQFVLKGCPGESGQGAKGGKGGKGGEPGEGGQGWFARKQSDGVVVHEIKCVRHAWKKGPKGNAGSEGIHGVKGAKGKDGNSGAYELKNLDQDRYDDEIAEVILRQADDLYMKAQTREALKLYGLIYAFTKEGKSKEYSKLMIDKINAGLNYYGFIDKYIMATDMTESDARVESTMNIAKQEDERIDKRLYREHVKKVQNIRFKSLTDALKENNNGIKRETDTLIGNYKSQRNYVVVQISKMEDFMTETIEDLKRKLGAALRRQRIDTVLKLLEISFSYMKPKTPDIGDLFETVLEVGEEAADCGDTYDHKAMTTLMETAVQFNEFEGKSHEWETVDLSKLKPQAAAEMMKVLTKDKIGALEESFECLFEHGKEGLKLAGAIGTYLDFALTRITFIGEIYKIDMKLAEYKIRLKTIQQTNENVDIVARDTESRTAEVILNKVAITEDLIQTFEETAKDVLTALYIQTESLRFITLWDFKGCLAFYIPNHLIRAERKSYFDGYRPLASLRQRIDKYKVNYKESLKSMHAKESRIQNWIVEFKDKDSEPIRNLREGKGAQIVINETFFRSRGDTNFRLHKLYTELIFKDDQKPKLRYILINVEHLGDNHFYVERQGKNGPLTLYQDASAERIKSRVEDQEISSCADGNVCHGNVNYPAGVLKDVCDVSPVRNQLKRSRRMVKIPCRSPFATYHVQIPIGVENKVGTAFNPSSTDTTGIIGLKFLIGVSFWENYPKSKGGCPE